MGHKGAFGSATSNVAHPTGGVYDSCGSATRCYRQGDSGNTGVRPRSPGGWRLRPGCGRLGRASAIGLLGETEWVETVGAWGRLCVAPWCVKVGGSAAGGWPECGCCGQGMGIPWLEDCNDAVWTLGIVVMEPSCAWLADSYWSSTDF